MLQPRFPMASPSFQLTQEDSDSLNTLMSVAGIGEFMLTQDGKSLRLEVPCPNPQCDSTHLFAEGATVCELITNCLSIISKGNC